MLHLNRVEVGGRKYQPTELTFNGCFKIATIAEKFNESRITEFLKQSLGDSDLPYVMTAQERYYLLIRYLATQKNTLLGVAASFENYTLTPEKPWRTSVDIENFTIQQLTGRHLEVLEEVCENAWHWVIGSLAFQMVKSDIENMPALPTSDIKEELDAALKLRVSILRALPQSRLDGYYNLVQQANEEMTSLVRLGVDNNGITVLGGEGDDSMRFRPAAAFTGIVAVLARHTISKGA